MGVLPMQAHVGCYPIQACTLIQAESSILSVSSNMDSSAMSGKPDCIYF